MDQNDVAELSASSATNEVTPSQGDVVTSPPVAGVVSHMRRRGGFDRASPIFMPWGGSRRVFRAFRWKRNSPRRRDAPKPPVRPISRFSTTSYPGPRAGISPVSCAGC